jgi:hypothetical protein
LGFIPTVAIRKGRPQMMRHIARHAVRALQKSRQFINECLVSSISTTARGPERDERWGRVRGGDVRDDRPGTVVATAQWRERARDGR